MDDIAVKAEEEPLPPDPDAEGLIPIVPAERYPDGE